MLIRRYTIGIDPGARNLAVCVLREDSSTPVLWCLRDVTAAVTTSRTSRSHAINPIGLSKAVRETLYAIHRDWSCHDEHKNDYESETRIVLAIEAQTPRNTGMFAVNMTIRALFSCLLDNDNNNDNDINNINSRQKEEASGDFVHWCKNTVVFSSHSVAASSNDMRAIGNIERKLTYRERKKRAIAFATEFTGAGIQQTEMTNVDSKKLDDLADALRLAVWAREKIPL